MRTDGDDLLDDAPRRDTHRVAAAVAYRRKVASSSEPGVFHTVLRLADGRWLCTCRGFRFGARADGLCRHIDGEKDWDRLRIPSLAALLAAA